MPTSPTPHERKTVDLEKIIAGLPAVKSKGTPDAQDKKEEKSLEIIERTVKIDQIRQLNTDRRINRKLRTGLSRNVFCYLVCYSFFVASIVVAFGLGYLYLPDSVLAAMVGSTAVAAIGLVGFVVSALFRNIT